ncbi:MAG: hypothetical protein HOW73_48175 [Polyangiaceae bacterium]|nr:hypothetical protein [Polyangiaceae bacterium]
MTIGDWLPGGFVRASFAIVAIGAFTVVGCGDDTQDEDGLGGSAEGGGSEGGGAQGGEAQGGDGAGGSPTQGIDGQALTVAAEGETADCVTFQDGAWATGTTTFNANGEAENLACALIPVDAGDGVYWITSTDFEGSLGDNELRHSFSTSEAPVAVGSSPLELAGAATPDTALFSGTLTVGAVEGAEVTVTIE